MLAGRRRAGKEHQSPGRNSRRLKDFIDILWRLQKDPTSPSPEDLTKSKKATTQGYVDTIPQRKDKQLLHTAQMIEEKPRNARLAVRSSTQGYREENVSTPAGRLNTVGRGQRPQTLPHSDQLKQSGDKEDPFAESYDEEENSKTDEDASILEETHPTNFRAIVASIQALASAVASIQLASRRRMTGRQIYRGIPSQGQDLSRGQALGAVSCTWPPSEYLGRQIQQAAPSDTLPALGSSGGEDSYLSAFPELFSLLEEKQGTSLMLRLQIFSTLLLTDQPLLLLCMVTQELHIRVLWEVHHVTQYFTRAITEDGTVLTFA